MIAAAGMRSMLVRIGYFTTAMGSRGGSETVIWSNLADLRYGLLKR